MQTTCPRCEAPLLGQPACPHCGTLVAEDWRLRPEGAHCARHFDKPATGICARCGDFLCAACALPRQQKIYCYKCIAKIAPAPDLPTSVWVWGGHLIFRDALLVFPVAAVAFAARLFWIGAICGVTAFVAGYLMGRKYVKAIHRPIPAGRALAVTAIGLGFQFVAPLALYRVFSHLLTDHKAMMLFLVSIPGYIITTYLGIYLGGRKN